MAQGSTHGVPIDTDGSLSANSDLLVPSEKAVVSYVNTAVNAIVVPPKIPDGRRYWMATQNKGASSGVISINSTYSGSLWLFADPNFSVGTSYERVNYLHGGLGLVQLAPGRTFSEVIADAKTTVPGGSSGWAWAGTTANLASADSNTTTANAIRLAHNGSSTDDFYGATLTSPRLYRSYEYGAEIDVVVRMKFDITAATSAAFFYIADALNNNTHVRMYLSNNVVGNQWDNGGSATNGSTTAIDYHTNPVWLRMRRTARGTSTYYSTANQATPPTSWSLLQNIVTIGAVGETTACNIGFGISRASSTAGNLDVYYFDDTTAIWRSWGHTNPSDSYAAASGFDNSSPILTLVSGYDLGSSGATVTDADVQAALTEITNPRALDTAAWTYSVTRGSSAPVSPVSYASSGSVSVSNSGRYISVAAKAASTNRAQPGSINTAAFRIPYVP